MNGRPSRIIQGGWVLIAMTACVGAEPQVDTSSGSGSGGSAGSGLGAGGAGSGTGGASAGGGSAAGGAGGRPDSDGGSKAGAPGAGGTSQTGGASGTGGAAGGAGGGPTLADGIQQFSDAYCQRLATCTPGLVHWDFGTYTECFGRTVLENTWETTLPGNVWTAGAFAACADAWKSAPCSQIFEPIQPAACNVPGTRATGQPCNTASQCASSFCKTAGWSCGQCAASPPAGSSCQYDWDCGMGTSCMPSNTCQPLGGLGQSCSDTLLCRGNLVCVQGQCAAAPATLGASCSTTTGLSCDWTKDLICSGSTCVAFSGVATGQSCGATSYCAKYGVCTSGTCQAGPSDTAACDATTRHFCEWPAVCVSGRCQLPTNVALCAP